MASPSGRNKERRGDERREPIWVRLRPEEDEKEVVVVWEEDAPWIAGGTTTSGSTVGGTIATPCWGGGEGPSTMPLLPLLLWLLPLRPTAAKPLLLPAAVVSGKAGRLTLPCCSANSLSRLRRSAPVQFTMLLAGSRVPRANARGTRSGRSAESHSVGSSPHATPRERAVAGQR